ncbi:MAG TPA: hypothetical protein VIO58_12555 [Candidatus Methanoperedens sp.]
MISKDKAKIQINIPTFANLVSKKSFKKGELLTREDIADIRKIHFKDIELDLNFGIIYIFSYNWMKCVYFDHSPVLPENLKPTKSENLCKTEDLESLFASFYSYIMFPEVFRIEPEINEKILMTGWFPFIRILGWRFEEIYKYIKNNFTLNEGEMKVVESFDDEMIHNMMKSWMTKDIFKKHENIIRTGIERYIEKDYISAIHILFPRIEGIMRYIYLGTTEKSSQNNLVDKLTDIAETNNPDSCLFLPNNFNEFLKKFYFNNFDLEKGDLDLSRNTIGHGVVRDEDLNRIKAFQAILILDQMFFYV